jgi:3D (Asp-Asp-Asp) domain-containing protein
MLPSLRGRLLVFVVGLLAMSVASARELSASHFRWLGHDTDVPPDSRPLGKFVPTFYRILNEAAPEWSSGTRSEELLTRDGGLIARVSPAFKHRLDVEGSARLRDGRIINIEDRAHGRLRYLVVHNAPFGVGEPGFKLIPYRTVAVDPRRIKLGTVLYLPSLAGVSLPSGEVHDGFCFAHDTGRGITGNRIDIFVGFESDRANALTRSNRIASNEAVRVLRVDGQTARAVSARFKKDFAWDE